MPLSPTVVLHLRCYAAAAFIADADGISQSAPFVLWPFPRVRYRYFN